MIPKLYDNDEAAKMLRVSPYTLRVWVYQGRLKPVKLGRRVLFTEETLQAFINEGIDRGRETGMPKFEK